MPAQELADAYSDRMDPFMEWQAGPCAKVLCARAAKILAELAPALLDGASGMLRPATDFDGVRPHPLTDVWGSSYAAFLDGTDTSIGAGAWPVDVPPPLSAAQRAAVGEWLVANGERVFAAGQVRHLPVGQSWTQQWCSPVQVSPDAWSRLKRVDIRGAG